MIRYAFMIIFALLIAALLWCSISSFRSKKSIGMSVCLLCLSIIPPILGNMIIIGSTTRTIAFIGCYLYYIGMDLFMYTLIRFTNDFCHIKKSRKHNYKSISSWINYFLIMDSIQLLLNIPLEHAFDLREIEAYGKPYFIMTPLIGQAIHRLICYGALTMVMVSFIIRCIKVPRLYKERYYVILISMGICSLWETFYIFSQTPIDSSMFGFAIFGLLVFYFSLNYRPLRLLDSMLAEIVSDTNDTIVLFGPEGRCIWANEPAIKHTGLKPDDYEGITNTLSNYFGEISALPEGTETEITRGPITDEHSYLVAHGTFSDKNNRTLGSYIRVRDITAEKRRMEEEMFAANHDALTGVYNKEYTFKKISDQLKSHALSDYYIASITICDFKVLNDVFGKELADTALKQVADWVRQYADNRCIYGRITADTFCSCLPKEMFFQDIVENDLSTFAVKMGDIERHLTIHVGFCAVEDDDKDVPILFDRAMMALDSIRNDYKTHVAFFDKKIRDRMLWNQEISAQLDIAIEENQIVPYLQPIADRNGKIIGAEALARWIHPVHGFMSPGDFIPLFEENGMIADLDKHIWKSACALLSAWETKYPDLFLSVNVSPNDFYMTDVLAEIMRHVIEYDIDPRNLRIEVTETSMMSETDGRMKVLEEFRKQGFIVEMDDFGSGYSSLNMLKNMPVDVLKLDMKFLGKSSDEQRSDIIVKNVIQLSRDLNIISLAEGVETAAQFDKLNKFGCDLFQGYYFSKPVPANEFETMLSNA